MFDDLLYVSNVGMGIMNKIIRHYQIEEERPAGPKLEPSGLREWDAWPKGTWVYEIECFGEKCSNKIEFQAKYYSYYSDKTLCSNCLLLSYALKELKCQK